MRLESEDVAEVAERPQDGLEGGCLSHEVVEDFVGQLRVNVHAVRPRQHLGAAVVLTFALLPFAPGGAGFSHAEVILKNENNILFHIFLQRVEVILFNLYKSFSGFRLKNNL